MYKPRTTTEYQTRLRNGDPFYDVIDPQKLLRLSRMNAPNGADVFLIYCNGGLLVRKVAFICDHSILIVDTREDYAKEHHIFFSEIYF